MQALESEYHQLRLSGAVKQRASQYDAKYIAAETARAYKQLFSERLTYQDLCELAASSDTLPIHTQEHTAESHADLLEYMVQTFAAMGDRDTLVDLLSKHFVTKIGARERIEYYLATQANLAQDFRGCRLRDPILVLGVAYARCRTPEVREEIAAAVRRAFAGSGIEGKDDPEFVENAMRWYEKEKDHLVVNDAYIWNDNLPLDSTQQHFGIPSQEVPGGRQPLFVKTTSAQLGTARIIAVIVIWLIHLGVAAILSAPIVYFGRKRIRWRPWEMFALILPFAIWVLLMASPLSMGRKGLGNLVEPFYLALGVPIAVMVRVWKGPRFLRQFQVNLLIAALIAALCIIAASIFFFVPPLLSID